MVRSWLLLARSVFSCTSARPVKVKREACVRGCCSKLGWQVLHHVQQKPQRKRFEMIELTSTPLSILQARPPRIRTAEPLATRKLKIRLDIVSAISHGGCRQRRSLAWTRRWRQRTSRWQQNVATGGRDMYAFFLSILWMSVGLMQSTSDSSSRRERRGSAPTGRLAWTSTRTNASHLPHFTNNLFFLVQSS